GSSSEGPHCARMACAAFSPATQRLKKCSDIREGMMKAESQRKEVVSHPFHHLLIWASFVVRHLVFVIRWELDTFLRTNYTSPTLPRSCHYSPHATVQLRSP